MISSFGRHREATVMFCAEALRNAYRGDGGKRPDGRRVAVAKRSLAHGIMSEASRNGQPISDRGRKGRRGRRADKYSQRRWRVKLHIAGRTLSRLTIRLGSWFPCGAFRMFACCPCCTTTHFFYRRHHQHHQHHQPGNPDETCVSLCKAFRTIPKIL